MNPTELSARLWDLAARVGQVVNALPESRLGRHVAGHLVHCSTASPQNYDQSREAEGPTDSLPHLRAAWQELRATRGWLRFLVRAELLPPGRLTGLVEEAEELCRFLRSALLSAEGRKDPGTADDQSESPGIASQASPFRGLDHLAIVVPDTEAALRTWRDTLGFPVLFSEVVNGGAVRLTHLDLGNTHLQLVQPLTPDHPLAAWLARHGTALHHFCLRVENLDDAMRRSPVPTAPPPHQGTQGKRAVFLDPAGTEGVPVELTGK